MDKNESIKKNKYRVAMVKCPKCKREMRLAISANSDERYTYCWTCEEPVLWKEVKEIDQKDERIKYLEEENNNLEDNCKLENRNWVYWNKQAEKLKQQLKKANHDIQTLINMVLCNDIDDEEDQELIKEYQAKYKGNK